MGLEVAPGVSRLVGEGPWVLRQGLDWGLGVRPRGWIWVAVVEWRCGPRPATRGPDAR